LRGRRFGAGDPFAAFDVADTPLAFLCFVVLLAHKVALLCGTDSFA
jgi:hypothetical protein